MTDGAQLLKWLDSSEPQLPVDLLIERVNNLYHSLDAEKYDQDHPEIYVALPEIWTEMIQQLPGTSAWRVLDYGCGTGFEACMLMDALGSRLERIFCYDPSPEMLARCARRFQSNPQVQLSDRASDIALHGPYNLLITNSVLHHLPSVEVVLASILPSLTSDAMWLAGHEPSARFYRNPDCLALLAAYKAQRRWSRFLDARAYADKCRQVIGKDVLTSTARVAFKRGWFRKMPSALVISRLVDFHVAHDSNEAANGRGFDIEQMQISFKNLWSLVWMKSYSFLGPYKEVTLPQSWKSRCQLLARAHPSDGANFSSIWKKL